MNKKILEIKNEKSKNKIIILSFFFFSFMFSLPSIIYWIQNQNIYKFVWTWTYLFKRPTLPTDKLLNAVLFFIVFSILFLLYFLFMKYRNKIFKNIKQILIFVFIIGILFVCIIPYTSLDIYSYIANGWSAAHYNENPYYVATGEIAQQHQVNDQMFSKVANCWRFETVVYGPLWTLICTVLSALSFGNLNIALIIFKLANLIIHLCNCFLIHKMTKRKLFVILYGLNPFILFEAIGNVHNDIFIIFFVLLAIYFITKKKNLFLAVAFIAMATAIKYLAILILPFIVLYAVKDKEVKERIKCCIYCGIEYLAIIAMFYLIYLQDAQVLAGLVMQQAKYNRTIFFLIYYLFDKNTEKVAIIQNISLVIFAVYYLYIVIKLLLQKEIKWKKTIQKYHIILVIFTFIIITNFNPWYIMWLFPTAIYLTGSGVKSVIYISYASQIGNVINFALWSEEEKLGIPYFIIMTLTFIMLNVLNREKTKKAIKEKEEGD